MASSDLCFETLAAISGLIKTRRISSTEITRIILKRIEMVDGRLHSFARVTPEAALQAAANADTDLAAGIWHGPLHGVPIAVKDLFFTRGIVTAAGMPIRSAFVPDKDATVVARLKAAGAVLLGKLQMTEGAYGAHHSDIAPPLNPWSESHWSGASSSGSGVATAAGMCFGSLGTDTLGSIRFPSTVNGICGLKPTWGRVSRAGVFALAESLDHVGPMTRCVEDAALILSAIAGPDADDPTASQRPVPDYSTGIERGVKGLRIGVDRRLVERSADEDMIGAWEQALKVR